MKFDVTLLSNNLRTIGNAAKRIEDYGFDALWTAETNHNPFLPLPLVAEHTARLHFGTAIALAFPRSPMVTAHIAWDLAAASGGRFMLGLGTQIKAHITKRFSTQWSAPVPRLREYVESLRAIWNTWRTGEPLRYRGEIYQFSLMPPFFSPENQAVSNIPIYLSGVNDGLATLAGQEAQGFHIHPFHTVDYLRQRTMPALATGAARAGKTPDDIERSCAVFVITGRTDEEIASSRQEVKRQIAFYASTPSYRSVLDVHGIGDLQERLSVLARQGQWQDMADALPDMLVDQVAMQAHVDELAHAVRERYDGILTRVGYYLPFTPDDTRQEALWRGAAGVFV